MGKQTAQGTCNVDGCERKVESRGLCPMHYQRMRKWGNPEQVKKRQHSPHVDENKALIQQGKLRCARCNRIKKLSLFYKKTGTKLGYQVRCKVCSDTKHHAKVFKLRQYELTPEEYDQLHDLGEGKCWICGGGSTRALSVDHNHANGNVRGLLCVPCNATLGKWRDDPEIVMAAYRYLREDGKRVFLTLGRQPRGSTRDG